MVGNIVLLWNMSKAVKNMISDRISQITKLNMVMPTLMYFWDCLTLKSLFCLEVTYSCMSSNEMWHNQCHQAIFDQTDTLQIAVANFWHFPIRRQVTIACALKCLFIMFSTNIQMHSILLLPWKQIIWTNQGPDCLQFNIVYQSTSAKQTINIVNGQEKV